MTRTTSAPLRLIALGCILLVWSVQSFLSPQPQTNTIRVFSSSQDDDWLYGDSDDGGMASSGDGSSVMGGSGERSQIPQFIDAFLHKERQKRGEGPKTDIYTHMIGVPMTDCHQLQIELESVQRAILYHCPSLVHACIVPSMSRMPLLYVDASREPAGKVTMDLTAMVEKVVHKHMYVKQDEEESPADEANYAGINQEGYKPLTMTFHKLQIDGDSNDALFTVADKDDDGGLERLQAMVQDLQDAIQERGWKSTWPPTDVQGMHHKPSESFLPRIPFMRLPLDFERHLEPADEESGYRSTEDGGNGISPVFWIKWENDVMGRSVRLREVAIYPRRPGMNELDERTFYIPHETVELPDGNEALSQQEKVHQDYSEKRMKESERQLNEEDAGISSPSPDGDFMDPSLSDNRKILESIYGKDATMSEDGLPQEKNVDDDDDDPVSWSQPPAGGVPLDDWMLNRIKDIVGQDDDGAAPTTAPPVSNDGDTSNKSSIESSKDTSEASTPPLDDWMQDRLRKIVENRPSQVSKNGHKKDNVPALDNNPVFKAYRDGTLTKDSESLNVSKQEDVSAFPSEDLLRGFWRVVRSPLSTPLEKRDESRSDNFVLRVDGTISGGPMLDAETQQKASGGTWRMLEAIDETLLRIRLVIPPKKDRIMVWEGEIYKERASISNSASLLEATAFGKTDLGSDEEVIKCSGTVWVEDAVTKKNREELGPFVLSRVATSNDPKDFTITIPKSVRSQD